MFRKMRRDKQKLSKEECISILNTQLRGVLAVLGDDDYPYSIPLNHLLYDNKLYFHGSAVGHKIDAIEKYDKVSYCVLDDGIKEDDNWWYCFRSVVVFGRISKVYDEKVILHVLKQLGNKFTDDNEYIDDEINNFLDKVLILELEIEHISGKKVEEK